MCAPPSRDPLTDLDQWETLRRQDLDSAVSRLEMDRARHGRTADHSRAAAMECNREILATYQRSASHGSRVAEIRALLCAQADDDTPQVDPLVVGARDRSDTAPDDRDQFVLWDHDDTLLLDTDALCWWTLANSETRAQDWSNPGECGQHPWDTGRDTDCRATDMGSWKGSARDRVAQVADTWTGDLEIFKAMVRSW